MAFADSLIGVTQRALVVPDHQRCLDDICQQTHLCDGPFPSHPQDLPDELLLCCVDGSLRLCVKLAGANKLLKVRLQSAATERGLRLQVANPEAGAKIEKALVGFHVGELVLPRYELWILELRLLTTQFPHLHTVQLDPSLNTRYVLGDYVKTLMASYFAIYGVLAWFELKLKVVTRRQVLVCPDCFDCERSGPLLVWERVHWSVRWVDPKDTA